MVNPIFGSSVSSRLEKLTTEHVLTTNSETLVDFPTYYNSNHVTFAPNYERCPQTNPSFKGRIENHSLISQLYLTVSIYVVWSSLYDSLPLRLKLAVLGTTFYIFP
jgi:hypothetical protein